MLRRRREYKKIKKVWASKVKTYKVALNFLLCIFQPLFITTISVEISVRVSSVEEKIVFLCNLQNEINQTFFSGHKINVQTNSIYFVKTLKKKMLLNVLFLFITSTLMSVQGSGKYLKLTCSFFL